MSLSETYRKRILRKRDEVNRLLSQRANEFKKIATHRNKIISAKNILQRTKSTSTIQMKTREIQREEKKISDIEKKLAEIDKKISNKEKEIAQDEQRLNRAIQSEMKKKERTEKRRFEEIETFNFTVNRRLKELTKLPEKITVLFMASNPIDCNPLRLDEEARQIQEMIRKSEHRDSIIFETRWATRTLDVIQAINEEEPTIVHFSGHGSDQDEIVFQDNQGNAKFVSKEAIIQTIMSTSDNIKLVFFNTCFSYGQAEAVVKHVDAAIGMKTSISDEAARVFAAQFYSAIGFGLSVNKAFNQGKSALMLEGIPEEDTPELYVKEGLNPDDLIIVKP